MQNQASCAHGEFFILILFEFLIKIDEFTSYFISFYSCKDLPGILNVKYTKRSIISIHANDGHSAAGLNKSKVYYDESSATRKFL